MTGPLDEIAAALEVGQNDVGPVRPEVILPNGYEISSAGLYWAPAGDGKGNTPEPLWLCSGFEVTAMARDADGEDWSIVVEFRDLDNRLKREIIGRDELAGDAVEVRRRLMRRGLSLSSSRAARERLQAALASVRTSARVRLVYSAGWQAGNYVLPHRTIGAATADPVLFRGKAGGANHGEAGTYEAWRACVATPMLGNAAGLFAVSAAFAAPLLRDLDGEGGGFHLRGKSSKGKSTLQRVAGSVWGGGGEIGFGQSWRHTDNALEGVALAHNDGLLVLDELKQVAPEAAGQAAYSLATGIMKGRLKSDGESRDRPSWRVVILSSGEMSLGDMIRLARRGDKSYAGQELRLLDLPIDLHSEQGVWEALPGGRSGEQAAGDFSEQLRRSTVENYGWAGPMFVERYLGSRQELRAVAVAAQSAFMEKVLEPGDTSQIRRGAQRFALIAAGGELASQLDVVPWPNGTATEAAAKLFRMWAASFGRKVQHEDQEAITRVRSFLQRFEHARFRPLRSQAEEDDLAFDEAKGRTRGHREAEARSLDAAGWREAKSDQVLFHIFPDYWRTEIFAGMDAVAAARSLKAKGYLVSNGGPSRHTNRVSIDNAKQSFYTVPRAIMDDEAEGSVLTHGADREAGDWMGTDEVSPDQSLSAAGSQVRTVLPADDEASRMGEFEERAAMLEHQGGMTREAAEAQARRELGLDGS